MLRLTREVRLTLPVSPGKTLAEDPGLYLVMHVTLAGEPEARSSYIENIKVIDEAVRTIAGTALAQLLHSHRWHLIRAAQCAGEALKNHFGDRLFEVRLSTNPHIWAGTVFGENDMTTLTHRFDFSAAHRLHNDQLDDRTNREVFGKCNNPAGHGHNYDVEVTITGDSPDCIMPIDELNGIVNRTVIERFDHMHLNLQTEEFREVIPSVENIARVIYGLLKGAIPPPARLHSVRVWETAKTHAEYSE